MIRLLSAFSGTSEETIRRALDQLVSDIGEGSGLLVITAVLQVALIAYFLIVWGLAQ